MTALSLTLPLPCTTNKMAANVPGRGRVKTRKYQEWIAAAYASLSGQKPYGGFPRIDGPFVVYLEIPERAKGDVDNRIKATLDFLERSGIVANDKLCQGVSCFRADTVTPGSIFVRVFWGKALEKPEAA